MNKFAKGSLAAGAGLVLLLGGAGTLAYWNSEADLQGGVIEAGTLTLEAGTGQWAPEITTWVPGDESTYSTTLQLTTKGDNIQGDITLDEGSVVIRDADGQPAPELAKQFDIDFAPADASALPATLVSYDEDSETFTFDGAGETAIDVEVTVTFPFGDEPENAAKGATVDLSDVTFTATQTQAN